MKKRKLEKSLPNLIESLEESDPNLPAKSESDQTPVERKLSVPFSVRITNFFVRVDKVCKGVDKRFEEMNETEQDRYFQRLGITGCVALSCIVSGFFYWSLPPIWRVLLVAIFMGLSWWLGATVLPKLVTPDGRKLEFNRCASFCAGENFECSDNHHPGLWYSLCDGCVLVEPVLLISVYSVFIVYSGAKPPYGTRNTEDRLSEEDCRSRCRLGRR